MVTSHVSTGMKNVPVVVKTKNAEEILEEYLINNSKEKVKNEN